MKFSYTILKSLVPAIRSPEELAEKLTNHLFEVESIDGDALEVKILANRYSDAASYWGLARVVGAVYGKEAKIPEPKKISFALAGSAHRHAGAPKIVIEAKKECRRMAVLRFSNVKIAPSPEWLVKTLSISDIRSINNLVDITNYVMLETGEPTHAFDYDKMAGGVLKVRYAEPLEELTTLDDVELSLDAATVVLADASRALDLAGIKGGIPAEITEETKNVLLTAGTFAGPPIYRASRKYGIQTDASLRFSHNLSPALVPIALARAAELITELTGGRQEAALQQYPRPDRPRVLSFDADLKEELATLHISEARARKILSLLGYTLKGSRVMVSAIRTDVENARDLLDDIVSVCGYETIPALPATVLLDPPKDDELVAFREKIRGILVRLGCNEIYTHSLTSDAAPIELENPLSNDRRFLRESLLPNIRRAIELNRKHIPAVRLFEIGTVFSQSPEGGAAEHGSVAIALSGVPDASRILRGHIQKLYEKVGIVGPAAISHGEGELHFSAQDGTSIGRMIADSAATALFEANIQELKAATKEPLRYTPPPKFPAIARDVSLFIPQGVRAGDIVSVIETAASSLLQELLCVDAYEERDGRRSLTFRFVFRASDRTLTDGEAEQELKITLDALTVRYHIELR